MLYCNMRILIIPLLLLCFLGACSKEKVEREPPEDYFPVYPGSFWEYNTGQRIEVAPSYKYAAIYRKKRTSVIDYNEYTCEFVEAGLYPEVTGFLPVDVKMYAKGYELYYTRLNGLCDHRFLLSEELGKRFTFYNDYRYPISSGVEVGSTLSTITLPNGEVFKDVITMRTWQENAPKVIIETYYAKDVGLIGEYQIEVPSDTIPKWIKYLVDYHVNS